MDIKRYELRCDLASVALIDAATCAATGSVSESWWHNAVRTGLAPQPAFRRTRCTRWRIKEVAEFWHRQSTTENPTASSAVLDKASKASAAAAKSRRGGKTSDAGVAGGQSTGQVQAKGGAL